MDTATTTLPDSSEHHHSHATASTSACPYAVALMSPEEDDDCSSHMSEADETNATTAASSLMKLCPAFSESCPFKDAKSADEVRKTLVKIPLSHFEKESFATVLKGLHNVNQKLQQNSHAIRSNDDDDANDKNTRNSAFSLPGGCPVQSAIKKSLELESFSVALEEFSLSAIMARMAHDMEQEDTGEIAKEDYKETQVTKVKHPAQDTKDDRSTSAVSEEDATEQGSPLETSKMSSGQPLLSTSLKTGTAESHKAAEDVYFVRNFVRGKIDRRLYARLVLMLHQLYNKLEELLDKHANGPANFGSCHFPLQLNRTLTLQEDVEYWHGTTTASDSLDSPATRDYIHRLEYLGEKDPLLLLAHAYTRYLGDLSGGKVLARIAKKAFGSEEGLAFYEFTEIPNAKAFKDDYRQALDALPLTNDDIQRIVREANVAFHLNMRLFQELDVFAKVPGASVPPMDEVLQLYEQQQYIGASDTETFSPPASNACPFQIPAVSTSGKTITAGMAATAVHKRCPWPWIVFHDPRQAMNDWQTWALIGLFLCWIWSYLSASK